MGWFTKRLVDSRPELAGFPELDNDTLRAELDRRLSMPQRHRLLQGYPMPKAMHPVGDDVDWTHLFVAPHRYRGRVLVGLLPHPFCVPEVKGCGFCTFPHEQHRKELMVPLAMAIARELGTHKARAQNVATAIYFGGGTANLVSDEALRILVAALAGRFGPGAKEVTLEGVPRFFREEQLAILADLGADRVRFSMGVQTFDEDWLGKMGRMKIGSPAQVSVALDLARKHDVQTSCDLLINLPGQPVDAMLRDVETAAEQGFSQICVYHLVLFEGLGTEWSKDRAMLDGLPANDDAFENWRRVRDRVLELGYEQSTLTNFERAELPPEGRFIYEPVSFAADTASMIGLGPGAISGTGHSGEGALKWINPASAEDYLAASRAGDGVIRPALAYSYDEHEDTLATMTRGLAGLRFSGFPWPAPKGSELELFAPELELLVNAGLLVADDDAFRPTERGMFYADSIAGLLAHRSVLHRRARGDTELLNDAYDHFMG